MKVCSPRVGAPSLPPRPLHGPVLPLFWNHAFFYYLIFSSCCLFDLLGNHRWSVMKSELRWEIIKNETFSLSSSCKTEARVCALGPWRGAQALFW